MRSTLLLTLTLFFTACSNDTANKQPTTSIQAETPAAATEPQPAVSPEPIKEEPVAIEAASQPAAAEDKESPVNGHTIFVHKCISCHGNNGEKVALNVSEVIAGWSRERTVAALKGYKDGSYGKSLKGIMKGQVSSLNDEQIEAVAKYIAIL